jgi:2-methylcitrate dehydratase PrpD
MTAIHPKLRIVYDPDVDAMDFARAQSTVRVTTTDGRVLERTVVRPLGIWDNPIGDPEREEKFRQCAQAAGLGADDEQAVLDILRRLPDADDVAELVDALRKATR